MKDKIVKCPKCGGSHYQCRGGTSTLLRWTPVHKDEKLLNGDPNIITQYYFCLECKTNFWTKTVGSDIISGGYDEVHK